LRYVEYHGDLTRSAAQAFQHARNLSARTTIALFVRNPGWHLGFDMDPDKAEATHRKAYGMLLAEQMPVQGFHFPFPSRGYVERDGAGYRLSTTL
jgi:hypothetical protein